MNKIALIIDTVADLNKDFIEKNDIKVLPFRIIYKGREYKDRVDITPDEVYERMKIGELLNLKPIISIDKDGKYFSFEMGMGRKKSLERLVSIGNGTLEKSKCKVFVRQGYAKEKREQIYNELSKHPNVISISLGDISPVASVHS